jgi:NAD(P)-dependent dehydrogenase (short-subunit alcohol dehydrogenase family)
VLSGCGASVALASRETDALQALAEELTAAGGARALSVALDVRNRQSVQRAVDLVVEELGGIDILVNNSGVTTLGGVLEQSEIQWDEVLETNLKGAFLVATEVARRMRSSMRGGSIINIASILGVRQAGQVAPYAVSKSGLIQLTKIMAQELARIGIRVNALAPGYIETDLNREFLNSEGGVALVKRIPQRRWGKPEDLDGPLLLLASDASRYMTGSVIVVDGGHLVSAL